jgi:uncharacterized YccA/Bax inhibitor family protein
MSFDQAMERVVMRRTYGVLILILISIVLGILASGCVSQETGGREYWHPDV